MEDSKSKRDPQQILCICTYSLQVEDSKSKRDSQQILCICTYSLQVEDSKSKRYPQQILCICTYNLQVEYWYRGCSGRGFVLVFVETQVMRNTANESFTSFETADACFCMIFQG
ncbi:unnamed protein product [Adineta ricciae]|uniref:Uncharacterized protein n=1 Tax=Adineta ricciae TaxID=249248 RepID=A0A815UWK3_ADIRI|nr:unnamed protein product [Adineta ricciae]